MPKTLSEIIADAAAANETTFEIAGEKFTLADVRGLHNTEKQALQGKVAEAERIAKEASTLLEGLQRAAEEAAKGNKREPEPDKKGSDWRKNPLYDELVPIIEAVEALAKKSDERATALQKQLEFSQAVYGFNQLRRQWDEAKVKPTGKTFEQVAQEVIANKEVDGFGLPTLERYLYRVTEPDRLKAASDAAVAAAKIEWDKASKLAAVPKPGTIRTRGKSAEAPIKNLSELTSEVVANDPDVLKAMEEGPVQ